MRSISNTAELSGNFTPIFVSGSPRSGTTVCHGMLCTSPNVNDYIAECSYLTGMLDNIEAAVNNPVHTEGLFGSIDGFSDLAREQISSFVFNVWLNLGSPQFLAFKDPMMLGTFKWIHEFIPRAKLVVTVRDPFETIASYLSVDKKLGVEITDEFVAHRSTEYANRLLFTKELVSTKPDQTVLIHYDDFFTGAYKSKFKEISDDIEVDESRLWESQYVPEMPQTAWVTENHRKKLSAVKRSQPDLTSNQRSIVEDIASAIYAEFMGDI
ncbi:Sulfotransferase family protein [Cohaesibacter sp. ES.047]|nr:Sulfotransferase family protein [Cohaesibacter sp. ES.047]